MHPDNILAAPAHANPYPYYAALVAGPPLVFDPTRKLWIAASAASVTEVLRNPNCHVRPQAEPVPKAILGSAAGDVFGDLIRMNDGVKHQAPKLAVQHFLAAVDLSRVQQRTAELAARAALHHGPMRGAVLSGWTFEVPVMAMADLLGLEASELHQVAHWMADFVACLSPLSTDTQLVAAGDAAKALLARFSMLASRASSVPRSALAQLQQEARCAGSNNENALLANLVGLLSQTYEATAGLIGNSLVLLASRPDLLDAVTGRPDQLLSLVQEVSRYDPSIHNTRRFVAQATQVAGLPLQAGDSVLLVLAAAGRDPLCNPRPDEFLMQRASRDVPGFGRGAHQCPGQVLACTIAAAALKALLEVDHPEKAMPRSWHYRPSVNARLPVFLD